MTSVFNYELSRYINANRKYFNENELVSIANMIAKSNKSIWQLEEVKYKSPTTATALAAFLGIWGIDRFYLGDYILGIIKMLTCGMVFVGWIFDLFTISDLTKERNRDKLYSYLTGEGTMAKPEFNIERIKTLAKDKQVQSSVKNFSKALKDGFKDITDTLN